MATTPPEGLVAQLGRLRELYTLLTDQSRARFGLIKGYRMVLEIEKASGLPELQTVAQRFLAQLREEQGEAGLRELRAVLSS